MLRLITFILLAQVTFALSALQWKHGIKHGLNVAKGKYRAAMRHQTFSVPGMHVPKTIQNTSESNPYFIRNKAYFYSYQKSGDPRSSVAYRAHKMRKNLRGYSNGLRYGTPRPRYRIYNDNGYGYSTRYPVSHDLDGNLIEYK